MQPISKNSWQPGPDDSVCSPIYVIVGADVLIFPRFCIDDPETKLGVPVAGLAHTPHIDEKLDPTIKSKCAQILPDDSRDVCVAGETHRN